MAPAKFVLGVTAIAITLMVPGLGRAQSCTSDADCAKGLSCQADPTPGSVSVECQLVDGGRVCTTTEMKPSPPSMSCKPAACASDADCGTDMVCHSETTTACTGGAPTVDVCGDGTECIAPPPPAPETCTRSTTSLCMYRWALPCNADADCGAGFICKPSEIGMCTGSGGTTPMTGGGTASEGAGGAAGGTDIAAPMPMDAGRVPTVTCTTTTSYPGDCRPTVTECTADSDCPGSWTCQSTNTTTTSPPILTVPVTTLPVAIDAGAAVVADPPPPDLRAPTDSTKTCQPPSTIYVTRGGGEDTGGIPITVPTKGADVDGGTTISIAPSLPDGGAGQGATTPPNPTAPGSGNSGPTTETVASTSGGGGCSVGGGKEASASAWLVLVGLGLLLARRGRRRVK